MSAGDEIPGAYRAPACEVRAELRERKSRFLAVVTPVADEIVAQEHLAAVRAEFPDATHHCWAWRLGARGAERSSDDGEPAGTAGPPILHVLRGAELSGVLAVVVRWFGGVKLGKGGLVRAYGDATRLALEELPVMWVVPAERLVVELPYPQLGAVKRLIRPPQVELVTEQYGEAVRLELVVHRHLQPEIEEALAALGIELPLRP